MKTNNSDNWLNVVGEAESCFSCFLLRIDDISEMAARRRKPVAAIKLGDDLLRSFWGRGRVKAKREVVHRGEFGLTRVNASEAFLGDKDEHAAMVQNVFLSQEYQILSANVNTTGEEKGDVVKGTLGERREECTVFTEILDPELTGFREESTSLASDVNEYSVRVKNLEKE